MKALVYHGPGQQRWDSVDDPAIIDPTSTPRLLRLVVESRLDPTVFATHRFALGDTMEAYVAVPA